MTQRQPRSTTMKQSITLESRLFTREAILVMAKGMSSGMIIRALFFTQINLELVSNKRTTRLMK